MIVYRNVNGEQFIFETEYNNSQPLDATGALATLLAVLEVLPVDDAANSVGLTSQDLINEAQAWAVASQQ